MRKEFSCHWELKSLRGSPVVLLGQLDSGPKSLEELSQNANAKKYLKLAQVSLAGQDLPGAEALEVRGNDAPVAVLPEGDGAEGAEQEQGEDQQGALHAGTFREGTFRGMTQ